MTDQLSAVARIESEIAATKVRIGIHLDALKIQLRPEKIVQDVAEAGLAAVRHIPARLTPRTGLSIVGALAGLGLLLALRSSGRTSRAAPASSA